MASCASSASTRFSRRRAAAWRASVNAPRQLLELRGQALALLAQRLHALAGGLHTRDLPAHFLQERQDLGDRVAVLALEARDGFQPVLHFFQPRRDWLPAPTDNRAARRRLPASSIRPISGARAVHRARHRCGTTLPPAWRQCAPAPRPIPDSRTPRRRPCPRSPAASGRSAARAARSRVAVSSSGTSAALSISLRWKLHRSSRRSFSCSLRSSSSNSAAAARHS